MIASILLYNFGLMKVRVSSSHIMISSLLSSWSYSLINLALIGRSLFIGRFSQLSWGSRYSRNPRIKLFSDRERFAKPYSAYSVSSALTRILFSNSFQNRALIFLFNPFFFKDDNESKNSTKQINKQSKFFRWWA